MKTIIGVTCASMLAMFTLGCMEAQPADQPDTVARFVAADNIINHMRWSQAGPIAGMHCSQILEVADPHAWNDNYLCVDDLYFDPSNQFAFSSSAPYQGMSCTRLLEPSDPDTWDDNYLCSPWSNNLVWSYAGPLAGYSCLKIFEEADPHSWNDNYLCTPIDYIEICDPVCP